MMRTITLVFCVLMQSGWAWGQFQSFRPQDGSIPSKVIVQGLAQGPTRLAEDPIPVEIPHLEFESHIQSNSSPRVNINNRVGANAFYAAGYTGTTSLMANIEAGHIWNGHSTLSHVDTFISGPGTIGDVNGVSAAYASHATGVSHVMGGRIAGIVGADQERGIAHGATMWSGAIATAFGSGGSFSISTYNAFFQPYVQATLTGINGQTADVVNSSWGSSNPDNPLPISAGRDDFSRGIDALAFTTNKIFVTSAGNSGSGADTVSSFATAYNVISVGALEGTGGTNPYNTVASYSSRGPNYAYNPVTDQYIQNARIRVDVSAPGSSIFFASYNSTNPNPGEYASGNGTSFASPVVAGGIALMVDAGRQLNNPHYSDARVIKAIVLNSADKTSGWSNTQTSVDGVITTTQALDPNVGAGRMNLQQALPYITSPVATRDVPGLNPGDQGLVARLGYDLGQVGTGSFNSYSIGASTDAGASLTVTLNWFVDRGVNSFSNSTSFSERYFADLDIEVWRIMDGAFTSRVAQSITQYNNTEHLHLNDLEAGEYGFRVVYFGDNWNFIGATSQTYAVAWSFTPTPEPLGILVLVGVPCLAVWLRRKSTGELA